MYSLFTSKSVLDAIWELGEECKWYSVLHRTDIREIVFPEDFNLDSVDPMGPQDELSAISQYIQITPKSKYLEYCKGRMHSDFITCMEKLTNALFLVDDALDESDIKYIGEEMGVYCQRLLNADELLFNPIKSYPLKKDAKDFSWNVFFTSLKKIPTKSAIICDRNIFSDGWQIGCKNLQSILDNLISSGRRTDFSFIVFFEEFSDKHPPEINEANMNNIKDNLKKFLEKIVVHRGLPLIDAKVDLVSVSRVNSYFEITHDRAIYCDYYTVSATHAISALDINGSCQKTQTISHSVLFSSIGNKTSDIIQQRRNVFPDYRKIFEKQIGLQCYRITGEGVSEISASDCLNGCRLLVDTTT